MVGNRIMGTSLMLTGHIEEGRACYDHAIALYDPAEHRPLATRFGQDTRVVSLSYRSWALWLLGYPEAARSDAEHALEDAREIGQAATLMFTLRHVITTHTFLGNYAAVRALIDELSALADQKGSAFWRATPDTGCLCALTGESANAIQMLTAAIASLRATGATLWNPYYLLHSARAHADIGQFEEACRHIAEAIAAAEKTKEKWCDAEIHRTAGEIEILSPEPDAEKAEAHFERALGIAREQHAKSWELRAAMSMSRLWRDQGKRERARDLLAPVYGWFTEGFDTLDLKEAKALLEELS